MNQPEFYQRLAEILDVDELPSESELRDFDEWDSLAVLSALALADSKYGVTLRAEEIRSVVTAADLAGLVEAKQKQRSAGPGDPDRV
jgi:acyl carrier protein